MVGPLAGAGLPKIHGYYAQVLDGFSVNDVTHSLHYLLKLLENMQRVDDAQGGGEGPDAP